MARWLLDAGPDIAVPDFLVMFMTWNIFPGIAWNKDTSMLRVDVGERSVIYEVLERHGDVMRLRWPD